MLVWLGVVMAAFVMVWLAVMLRRERAYRKHVRDHKRGARSKKISAALEGDEAKVSLHNIR